MIGGESVDRLRQAAALVPVWVPETDPNWRAYDEPADYCGCRFTMPSRKACGRPGVADVLRGKTQRWSYCTDHLYGRRWVNGRLWATNLRPQRLPDDLRGDGPCSRCGTADLPVWFTEDVFWNAVVRSAPLPWAEGDGFLCVECFVHLADERGYFTTGWRVLPEFHWETHDERAARLDSL